MIVVDNNSHDGSVEMIRERFPQVKLIANPDNRLFAIANNQGAEIANGDYLLLLNSDTLVYDDNLQRMVDFFDRQAPDVICIGPKILNHDKTIQSYGAPDYGYAEHFICQMGLHKRLPILGKIWKSLPTSPNLTHRVGWVSGSCMMVRRLLYNQVGGLNEKLVFYGEEPEFGFRTRQLGFRTLYFHEAEIIHLAGVSTKKSQVKKVKAFEEDMKQYESLIRLTNGFQGAINVTRLTILAARLKKMIGYETSAMDKKIAHETKVLRHLKQQQSTEINK